jgi:hypothetical protein
MSLVAFQVALARMTADPAFAAAVRADPARLEADPALAPLERRRLAAIARSKGMEANCMLYRANRLAPLALNCPDTLSALGPALEPLLTEFWAGEPETHVNFLVETDRFCRWLAARPEAPAALAREHALVAARLAETRRLADRPAWPAPLARAG